METVAVLVLPVLLLVGLASSASAVSPDAAVCTPSTADSLEGDCTASDPPEPDAPGEPTPGGGGPTASASDASPRLQGGSDDGSDPASLDSATASPSVGASEASGPTMALAADQAQFVVVFDANGGSGSMDAQVSDVPAALSAGAYTRPGYAFVGWNTAADGTGLALADGEVYAFDSDLTLFAVWESLAQFVVVFDANGGDGSMDAQVGSEPAPLSSAAFTRPGYVFVGWNVSPDGSGLAMDDGEVYAFDSDLTLFAQWVRQFVVVFDANGGDGSMDAQVGSEPAPLSSAAFTRSGYTFAGWNVSPDGTGLAVEDGEVFAFDSDLTLFAMWVPLAQYVVVFDANGGVGSMDAQIGSGSAPLSSAAFTRPGYVFVGWNTSPDGTGIAMDDGEVYAFDSDLTLFAQWVRQFVVVFDANGGDGSMDAQVGSEPAPLSSAAFTRPGYTFAGWNVSPDGTGLAVEDGEVFAFDSDLTLFAMWEPVPVGTLTVRHVVEGTETDLVSAETSTIAAGDQYVVQALSFDGHELVGLRPGSSPATGVMDAGETVTVVFEYRAVATLPTPPGETESPSEGPDSSPAGTELPPAVSELSPVVGGSTQVGADRRVGASATTSQVLAGTSTTGLPVTGTGLVAASVALVLLAAGSSVLIIARKRREQTSHGARTAKLG